MDRRGVGQTNRGLGGIGQMPQGGRNNQMSSSNRLQQPSRLPPAQNQWSFQGGAPGLPTPQGRAPGMAGSFAQTIGGIQPATSLDPSEFPSLSGGPSIQTPGHNQAIWSGQRQHTPIQQQQGAPPPQQQQNASNPTRQDHNLDDGFFDSSNGNMDEYRRPQNGVGQLSTANQQPAIVDEFPPLSRLGTGEMGGDRRMNAMQAGFGIGGAGGFPPGIGPPRNVQDPLRNIGHSTQNGNESLFSSTNETAQAPMAGGQIQPQTASMPSTHGNTANPNSISTNSTQGKPKKAMTDMEKYGLKGLLDAIKNPENEDFNLAIGHDLTLLGLDLNSSQPLLPTFNGPMADPLDDRPQRAITPDFEVPTCYTVTNVPPIQDKLPHFSDQTLFYIFYHYPQDILQELAAVELTFRSWRWNKVDQYWITKDSTLPEPTPIDQESERGRYKVFNARKWENEHRDLILHYSDLDDHISNAPPGSLP